MDDELTEWLLAWSDGDTAALECLMPRVYPELHGLARGFFAGEPVGHSLQPTALIHETYLKLIDQRRVNWQNRAHFFAVAAKIMRRVLVDHARRRRAAKRGGGETFLPLDEALDVPASEVDLEALYDSMKALERFAPRQCRIVELRFFGGLTIEETAAALRVSPATVKVDWSLARAWLLRELRS